MHLIKAPGWNLLTKGENHAGWIKCAGSGAEQGGGWGGVNLCEWKGLGGNMRISNAKIAGKAGRKGCVNVSRSVSVCQSDPWALSRPPGRHRQAGCVLEKRIPSSSAWPLFWESLRRNENVDHQKPTLPHLMVQPRLNSVADERFGWCLTAAAYSFPFTSHTFRQWTTAKASPVS